MTTELAPPPIQVEATLVPPRLILETDDADTVSMKLMALEAFKERSKDIIAAITESARLRLDDIGPVVAGEQFYWSARDKRPPKPLNVAATVEEILRREQGDFEALCRHFGSSPLKVGECRQTLGDAFDAHFVTETVDKLESDTATPRKLQNANKRFMDLRREKKALLAAHDAKGGV